MGCGDVPPFALPSLLPTPVVVFSTLKSQTSTSYPLSFVNPVQTTFWSAQMSSSSSYRPSHLHRVNLQSNGKRPFEECGYDSDPDPSSLNSGTQPSGSGSSGSSHHFSSGSSSNTGAGDGRNKRARSTSSSSNSGHSSSSDVSTSTGYDTAPSSSRSDLSLSGPVRTGSRCCRLSNLRSCVFWLSRRGRS
ncbi:hypothetical protein EDD15DRAFT_1801328 [Pisolithus albus]|nr:hypothetical protein EDD15DRAFT_1801328 [Pisolithus albus]